MRERDEFMVTLGKHGVPAVVGAALIRQASVLQKVAEIECSTSRGWCNGAEHCDYGQGPNVCDLHKREARARVKVHRLLTGSPWKAEFDGDPRGAVVKLWLRGTTLAERESSSDYIAVPSVGYTGAQLERMSR